MRKLIVTLFVFGLIAPIPVFAKEANDVTPIAELARGMSTTIHGEVTRILDEDEFRIEDKTGSVKVYIGWKNRLTVPVGETITVRGVVDDGLKAFFRPEFYALEIVRADGTVTKLARGH